MALIDSLLQELEQEAQTTRRVLERVPDNLDWRPHPKARSLGQLAMHVAMIPGALAELATSPSPAQSPNFTDPPLESASQLVAILDESVAKAKKILTEGTGWAVIEYYTLYGSPDYTHSSCYNIESTGSATHTIYIIQSITEVENRQ